MEWTGTVRDIVGDAQISTIWIEYRATRRHQPETLEFTMVAAQWDDVEPGDAVIVTGEYGMGNEPPYYELVDGTVRKA